MNAFLLLVIIAATTAQNVTRKIYTDKTKDGTFTFSWASTACAFLFFFFMAKGKIFFSTEYMWYAVAFAISYSLVMVTLFCAIKTGPLSLTALFTSYSLIIPTIYGIAFLGEKVTVPLFLGIILLLISILFVNFEKKGKKNITLKWIFYVFLTFAGNGACSVIQRLQQIHANGLYKNEFMIVSLFISTIAMLLISVFTERKNMLCNLKRGMAAYTVSGISNALTNLLVMVLALRMPASLSFPIISGGGIVANTVISVCFYKEKLSVYQKIGVLIGIGAILLLNM